MRSCFRASAWGQAWAALIAASCTSGCYLFSPNTDPPAEVEGCSPTASGGSDKRDVALGDGTGSDFVPYKQDGLVTLVEGGQGLSMITPVVRVEAASGAPSEDCFVITLRSESAASGAGGASGGGGSGGAGGGSGGECLDGCEPHDITQGAKMKLKDGYYYTDGVLYHPLDWDFVKLTLTVKGPGFTGTSTVEVHAR